MQIVEQQEVINFYGLNEIAKVKNIIILRFPPYHCELDSMELIWAGMKYYVATRNVRFTFAHIKNIDDWKSV